MTHSRGATTRECNCANGDECYGDYVPKGIKCRDLEPTDPGIDPVGAADDEPREEEWML